MRFQIRSLILWPKDTRHAPRVVEFKTGMVNVIWGISRTGKSAIVPIIDYCLGSKNCSIPVATIRDAVAWFGILADTEAGQLLLARREPGGQASTGKMLMREGMNVAIPREIDSENCEVSDVKQRLNELAGLSNLAFDDSAPNPGFQARPSFRDMLAFTFQPQNVVANPDVLFYRTNLHEHREKLRVIFPYALGAVTPAILAMRAELEQLDRERKRKERELSALTQVSERWRAELWTWVARAAELGLTDRTPDPHATWQELRDLLKYALKRAATSSSVTAESISGVAASLRRLEADESRVAFELETLRRRLNDMSRVRESAKEYAAALQVQLERLSVSTWLRDQIHADSTCPLCRSSMNEATDEVQRLCSALEEVEASTVAVEPLPATFDKEFVHIKGKIRERSEVLAGIKAQRTALEATTEEASRSRYQQSAVERFLGRLEQALTTYDSLTERHDLRDEVEALRDRIRMMSEAVNQHQIKHREELALRRISQFMGELLPFLDAERPRDPVRLVIRDLTLLVAGTDREDYLWEIGSGSNWLSYHVAVTVALQRFFLSQAHSPVPGLLIFDQPSQVYFPRSRVTALGTREFHDEDILAIRKVFAALADSVRSEGGALQVLVLDHADAAAWGGFDTVHEVEEWDQNRKLVPPEWL